MGVYIPNMEKPKGCYYCPLEQLSECRLLGNKFVEEIDILTDCPLIEIDDTVWENESHKLIRMTNEARINKAMAERRADDNTIKADK